MYESDDILAYIWAEYGPEGGEVALPLRLGLLTAITCGLASLARATAGGYEQGAKTAEQPLEVWGAPLAPKHPMFLVVGQDKQGHEVDGKGA